MKLTSITAYPHTLCLTLDEPCENPLRIEAYLPLVGVGREHSRLVTVFDVTPEGCNATISRFCGDYDLLTCRFVCKREDTPIGGVCYVTDFDPQATRYHYPEPKPKGDKPLGTWILATAEDMDTLGMGYAMTEINLAWLPTLTPCEQDIPYIFNGKTYYFRRDILDLYESFSVKATRRGIPCMIRFINRFHYQNFDGDPRMFEMLKHPCYDPSHENTQMCGFNLCTEEGFEYYCACLDFLYDRYTNPDNPYCLSVIMDIGNEVNAQGIWHNCGPMTCAEFAEEYSVALRTAWLLSHKYYEHYRINISLEHHFNMLPEPLPQYAYSAKNVLEEVARVCRRDGDFDFGISAHPYPSDLFHPDFYNDTDATFDFDTPKATMKNLEVWAAYAKKESLRYRGKPRRVLFDEQGFHGSDDRPETLLQGASAFVLACLKIRRQPGIDLFLIHRNADQLGNDEEGLQLGLRRSLSYLDDAHFIAEPGEPKPIYHAFCAIYTPQEQQWIDEARAYIGEELFDGLLHAEVKKS